MTAAGSNSAEAALRDAAAPRPSRDSPDIPAQYLLLVTCRDDPHQAELLGRLRAEGLECRPLLSKGRSAPPLPPRQAGVTIRGVAAQTPEERAGLPRGRANGNRDRGAQQAGR
jgi:hypothetical protein